MRISVGIQRCLPAVALSGTLGCATRGSTAGSRWRACTASTAAVIAALLSALPRAASADEARTLSFQQIIDIAVKDSPDLEVSAKTIDSAKRNTRATKALRLPKLSVDANVFVWDSALEIEFSIPGMDPPTGMNAPLTVRDRVTSTASVTLAEPLSGQLAINRLIEIDELATTAAEHDQRSATDAVQLRAAAGYLGLLQADAAVTIAESSVDQVQAQLDRARVLKEGGLLETVDVMRLEAALAAVRQQRILAKKASRIAQASLTLVLGLPSGTRIAARDDFPAEPKLYSISSAQAIREARAARPDLKAQRVRVEQADGGADAARANLFPNVAAVASFQHTEGQSTFQPKNAWFVGLTLQWDVWDWGRNWNSYQASKIQAKQAELAANRAEQRVALEVENLALDVEAAFEGMEAARSGLAAAEEAFRIQSARFSEGEGTTTDLLDSETEVTRARFALSSARYAYFSALVALAHGMGAEPPDVLSKI